MEIEYLTHASLLLRGDGVKLLTDPFFFPERDALLASTMRLYPPRPIDAAQFGRIDYVFSSHEHHDHCHPETLAVLRPHVGTVVLPAERPVLEKRYRDAGYSNIVLLKNGEPLTLRENLEVCAVWDAPVDTQLRVKLDGRVVVHGNDCRLRPRAVRKLAAMGPVDFAFLCSTSTQELYPLLLDRPFDELEPLAREREAMFFREQVQTLEVLKPRFVVPYSYTMAYVEPALWRHNACGRLTPELYRRKLARELPAQACLAIEPGDVVEADGGVRRFRERSLWGDSLQDFEAHFTQWAREQSIPPFDDGDVEAIAAPLTAWLAERELSARVLARVGGAVALEIGARRWLIGGDTPGLIITLPASLVQAMLDGRYDAYTALFTYKVRFDLRADLRVPLEPKREYLLLLIIFLRLFLERGALPFSDLSELEIALELPL